MPASYYHRAGGCNHSLSLRPQPLIALLGFTEIIKKKKGFPLPNQAEAGVCRPGLRARQRAKVLTLREGEVRPQADRRASRPITGRRRRSGRALSASGGRDEGGMREGGMLQPSTLIQAHHSALSICGRRRCLLCTPLLRRSVHAADTPRDSGEERQQRESRQSR